MRPYGHHNDLKDVDVDQFLKPIRRPIRAVIFDMDGTLHDTETVFFSAIKQTAGSLGFELTDEVCHAMIGVPANECDVLIQRLLGTEFPLIEFRRLVRESCNRLLSERMPIKSGAIALIDYLADSRIPMAVATSATRRVAELDLIRSGLRSKLPVVLTRDDVQHGKPYPDVFLKAASALGIEPKNCLAVEDSFNGIKAAHIAGMMTVMVPDILQPIPEIAALCIYIVKDLHELRAIVTKHLETSP